MNARKETATKNSQNNESAAQLRDLGIWRWTEIEMKKARTLLQG